MKKLFLGIMMSVNVLGAQSSDNDVCEIIKANIPTELHAAIAREVCLNYSQEELGAFTAPQLWQIVGILDKITECFDGRDVRFLENIIKQICEKFYQGTRLPDPYALDEIEHFKRTGKTRLHYGSQTYLVYKPFDKMGLFTSMAVLRSLKPENKKLLLASLCENCDLRYGGTIFEKNKTITLWNYECMGCNIVAIGFSEDGSAKKVIFPWVESDRKQYLHEILQEDKGRRLCFCGLWLDDLTCEQVLVADGVGWRLFLRDILPERNEDHFVTELTIKSWANITDPHYFAKYVRFLLPRWLQGVSEDDKQRVEDYLKLVEREGTLRSVLKELKLTTPVIQ